MRFGQRAPVPRRARWSRLRWFGLASLLLHAAVVALALLRPAGKFDEPEWLPPPSVEMVFESGAPGRPAEESAPSEAGPEMAAPPPTPPAAQPLPRPEPPVAQAPPPPVPPPVQARPPVPVPPPVPPPLAQAVPPPPAPPRPREEVPQQRAELALPPPPVPSPPVPSPPRPEAARPATPAPQPPRPEEPTPQQEAELPLPPPPTPPAPRPPQPRPAAPPRVAALPGTLYLPNGASLSPPSRPARAGTRALDLAVAPDARTSPEATDVRGAQVGPDWRNAFRRWLDENLRYPEAARVTNQQGAVRVEIVAEPNGRVRGVRLMRPSGSVWLDASTQTVFRGATIPAFPPGSDPTGVTVNLTVNYVLIRR